MGYKNASSILPRRLLDAVQKYIDGECLYIPRREETRREWGARTGIRSELLIRNSEIAAKRRAGCSVAELAEQYFLSPKAIYKIISAAQKG